jgi:hypothetical protein
VFISWKTKQNDRVGQPARMLLKPLGAREEVPIGVAAAVAWTTQRREGKKIKPGRNDSGLFCIRVDGINKPAKMRVGRIESMVKNDESKQPAQTATDAGA